MANSVVIFVDPVRMKNIEFHTRKYTRLTIPDTFIIQIATKLKNRTHYSNCSKSRRVRRVLKLMCFAERKMNDAFVISFILLFVCIVHILSVKMQNKFNSETYFDSLRNVEMEFNVSLFY